MSSSTVGQDCGEQCLAAWIAIFKPTYGTCTRGNVASEQLTREFRRRCGWRSQAFRRVPQSGRVQ
jgi:hypothetical protein